ncbi:pentatricopeptide repeat-containing protein At5g64320, mitochondrial-like [Trifolium pratense]|nr:pentatricopeptide repeat-containing protein At5g64320, mitochondrial-like [Trifolium pratense]
MVPPIPICSQFFQPHTLITIPFFNNNTISSIKQINPSILTTHSFSVTNSSIKKTTNNQLVDFKDKTTTFPIKNLVQNITSLSSSKTKIEMLQILEKNASEFQTISDFNNLLMALWIAQKSELCATMFTKLSSFHLVPDSCTYSIMIRCHCQKNEVEEAKRVLFTVLENGFVPDSTTITVLINSLCKRGKVKKAMEVFEFMERKGLKISVQQHNCLLKGLSYVGKIEEALEILMNMKKTNFGVDVYSYTAVMNGLCKVGRSDDAMDLLNEVVEIGLIPNVVTFNILIQGYSIEGRPMEGVGVLKMMKKYECVPDYISYNTVLHGLLKWNEIDEAFEVYKEMVEIGFDVDFRMMRTLVRRLCKRSWEEKGLLEDAYEVFEKMKERVLVVDKRTIEVMVEACCRGEKFDEALVNLNDMVRWGYSVKAIAFEKVIVGLCGQGRVDEAVSTLFLLHANGGIGDLVSYDVLVNELNAHGRVFCASVLFGFALKQGVVLVPNKELQVEKWS